MKVRGSWSPGRLEEFLQQTVSPLRLAFHDRHGFPAIVSLWYCYREGALWCAVPESSLTARGAAADRRCGFEVAVNDPPYRGARGPAEVTVVPERGDELLDTLIDRYLGDRSSSLARWLLDRQTKEVALRVDPLYVSTWDYNDRMEGARGDGERLAPPGYSPLAAERAAARPPGIGGTSQPR